MTSYYQKNRESILQRNKEYYHKKKEDPEFMNKLRDRNNMQYYNKEKKLNTLTEDDLKNDLEQMHKIASWIKEQRERDEMYSKIRKNYMSY